MAKATLSVLWNAYRETVRNLGPSNAYAWRACMRSAIEGYRANGFTLSAAHSLASGVGHA